MQNWSIGKTPFEAVYLHPPKMTLDLVTLPNVPGLSQEAELAVEKITRIHQEVTSHLQQSNAKYKQAADQKKCPKEYEVDDLVMVLLRKGRFPPGVYHKLKNHILGPWRIIKKINDNAYVLELPADLKISPTFNIADLSNYNAPDEFHLA